jgi:NADH dehydrogenase
MMFEDTVTLEATLCSSHVSARRDTKDTKDTKDEKDRIFLCEVAIDSPLVLVVGGTGQLGRVIVRKLAESGRRVRALARNAARLADVHPQAEQAAVDLLDVPRLTAACRGVEQIVATANNNMGSGTTSPTRVDLAGYQNLCAAARNAGVRRLIYVSYRGAVQSAPVDIFRVKWYIEDAIRRSGVPHVMLRPTAFMDIWIDELLAKGIREKGVATIFGDGTRVQLHRCRGCRGVRGEDPGTPRARE